MVGHDRVGMLHRQLADRKPVDPAEGFKILVEILARTSWTRVSELPYAFEPRLGGRSNFSRKEVARFAPRMFRLYRTLPQPAISAISPTSDDMRPTEV